MSWEMYVGLQGGQILCVTMHFANRGYTASDRQTPPNPKLASTAGYTCIALVLRRRTTSPPPFAFSDTPRTSVLDLQIYNPYACSMSGGVLSAFYVWNPSSKTWAREIHMTACLLTISTTTHRHDYPHNQDPHSDGNPICNLK